LMCAKNHLLIFSSFLDIWENVEWPRFFGPPCSIGFIGSSLSNTFCVTACFVTRPIRRHCQVCSGAGTRRSAVPANIFEPVLRPERRSGKYCLSQAER